MSEFRDFDPEDAYDAGDTPERRLDVLQAVVDNLTADAAEPRRAFRRAEALRLVANLDGVAGVDQTRLDDIRDDLEAL